MEFSWFFVFTKKLVCLLIVTILANACFGKLPNKGTIKLGSNYLPGLHTSNFVEWEMEQPEKQDIRINYYKQGNSDTLSESLNYSFKNRTFSLYCDYFLTKIFSFGLKYINQTISQNHKSKYSSDIEKNMLELSAFNLKSAWHTHYLYKHSISASPQLGIQFGHLYRMPVLEKINDGRDKELTRFSKALPLWGVNAAIELEYIRYTNFNIILTGTFRANYGIYFFDNKYPLYIDSASSLDFQFGFGIGYAFGLENQLIR